MADLTALLRRVYDTHDPDEGVKALLEISDPGIELWPAGLWLDDTGVVRGPDEVAAFFGRLQDAFEGYHFEPVRLEQRGETIAVAVRLEVRGRHSGLAESRSIGHLWRFRDGVAVEIRAYHTPEEAFEAL
ncbi:MAG TPA: nuclear transport factor 2 family protein [Thermoleophilaceae bacterium]|nr:nuclear transport factor 2 family protein [Thermoleophilaceae bacterium]